MSEAKKRPDLADAGADAGGAEDARVSTRSAKASVSTRVTRAAPWVGLLAVANAGMVDVPSVALVAAGVSVVAAHWIHVFGRRRLRRMRADDGVVLLGESEPKGTTLLLRDGRRVRGMTLDAPTP
ncbi:MAG: hypothetical protein MUE69_30840 [Myxococcota bacterium]|nr:hypothetical protein [Myxococcota bacterium]